MAETPFVPRELASPLPPDRPTERQESDPTPGQMGLPSETGVGGPSLEEEEGDYSTVVSGKQSDLLGDFPQHIILQYHNVIVYLDRQNRIRIQKFPSYGAYTRECVAIWADLKIAESRSTDNLRPTTILKHRQLLGAALAQVVEREDQEQPEHLAERYRGAQRLLIEAEKLRVDRLAEVSRFWYLYSALLWVGLTVVMASVIWFNRDWAAQAFGPHFVPASNCGFAGAIGAFMSIVLRLGSVNATPEAGRELHWVESGGRVAVGLVAGVLVYLSIDAGVILKGLALPSPLTLTYFVAFAAGLAERALPSLAAQAPGGIGKEETPRDSKTTNAQ